MWSTGTGTKRLCGVKQRNNLMRSPHSSLSLLGHISSQKIHKGERPPNAVKRGKMQRNDAPVWCICWEIKTPLLPLPSFLGLACFFLFPFLLFIFNLLVINWSRRTYFKRDVCFHLFTGRRTSVWPCLCVWATKRERDKEIRCVHTISKRVKRH